jgi:DNA-binding transcriptional LysR family regulator
MQALDLNLLRVLDVMLEERSVTRTAARMGLTQSAVSHALNRLRYALGDDLFLRGPLGMQPTPRALDMGPGVHAALVQLQAALAPADFEPASSERTFTLVAGSYPSAVLAPPLVARLADEAPLAELYISAYTPDVFDRMDALRVDFLISSVISAPARFEREVVLNEDLVWVVRSDHPLAQRGQVDLAALASFPHVVISPPVPAWGEETDRRSQPPAVGWENAGAFEAALAAEGLNRRVGISVPDTYSAMAVVVRSDMAVLVPRRLALASAMSGRFAMIEPPYQSPMLELGLIYLKDRLVEPAIAWMRELVHETARAI